MSSWEKIEADDQLAAMQVLYSPHAAPNVRGIFLLALLWTKKDHRRGRTVRQGKGGLCRVTGAKADAARLGVLDLDVGPGAGAGARCLLLAARVGRD